ncbi:uncharacterized protein LOC107030190 [Solanum pennellii]|uniref:Uncharacterized protein LOC107030190 n=1 Tax=Solanum pennellii TaxID=28526 RepID=A0ABM1HL20_SOLPN|nr:uncharacterized protein LOC107030190 [Solanum pennellii]
MVVKMRSKINLLVVGLSRQPSKEGKATMFIGDMDIVRIMIHVQQVEEDKLKDREWFKNKRPKISGTKFREQKSSMNSSFQQKLKGPTPQSSSSLALRNKGIFRKVSSGCFKCVETGISYKSVQRTCKEMVLAEEQTACMLSKIQEQEDSPDVVTGMIQVFDFTVYALLDPGASLSYVTSYVAMNFYVIVGQHSEP